MKQANNTARITFPKTHAASAYEWNGVGFGGSRRSARYEIRDAAGTVIGTIENRSKGGYMDVSDWTATITEDTTTTIHLGSQVNMIAQIENLRQATTVNARTLAALKANIVDREARRLENA